VDLNSNSIFLNLGGEPIFTYNPQKNKDFEEILEKYEAIVLQILSANSNKELENTFKLL
jgi:hypothetical protein